MWINCVGGFQDRDPVPLAFTDNARLAPTDFDSGSRGSDSPVTRLFFAGGQAWARSSTPALEIEDSLSLDTDYSMFRLKVANRGPGIAQVSGRVVDIRDANANKVEVDGGLEMKLPWSHDLTWQQEEMKIRANDSERLGVLQTDKDHQKLFITGLHHNFREIRMNDCIDILIRVRASSEGPVYDCYFRIVRDRASPIGFRSEQSHPK